jgi:phage-related protein
MKELTFLVDSYKQYRSFPEGALSNLGYNLHLIQMNETPRDWKPMNSIGQGVCELRYKEVNGAYRVIYYAKLEDAIYVLHAFQKKTQKTEKHDLDLAKARLKQLLRGE